MPFNILDKQISVAVLNFKESLESIEFDKNKSIEFILSNSIKDEFNGIPATKGIYLFEMIIPKDHPIYPEMKNDIFNFNEVWKSTNNKIIWFPGVKQKRCIKANEKIENYLNEEYIPFYIGKSNSINQRVKQHIFQDSQQTSFGMKLISRKNLYGVKFRVSIIEIDVENWNMIIPYMENHFRNKLNPIVGQ